MIQTVIQPAFVEVGDFAKAQGVMCTVECELGGVQPRAMFCVRPSGRSIRYELDADGTAVREVEACITARWVSDASGRRWRT